MTTQSLHVHRWYKYSVLLELHKANTTFACVNISAFCKEYSIIVGYIFRKRGNAHFPPKKVSLGMSRAS